METVLEEDLNQTETFEGSLSERLKALLDRNAKGIKVADMLNAVGSNGFGILLLFFSMPSALPVPAPGYSTPFGIIMSLLGLQMILGRATTWLPKKAQSTVIKKAFADKMLQSTIWFLKKTEPFIHPRLDFACGRKGSLFMGLLVIVMACIMIMPIPLTNTLPAMVIFLLAVGLIERDGLVCIGACSLGVLSFLIYVGALYVFLVYGIQGLVAIKDWFIELCHNFFHF